MDARAGRGDRIRTCGLCVPNATLYQAEPHPVTQNILSHFQNFVYPMRKLYSNILQHDSQSVVLSVQYAESRDTQTGTVQSEAGEKGG